MDPCDENVFSNRVPGLHNGIRPVGKGQENHNPVKPLRTRRPLGEISGNGNFIQNNIPSDRHNDFKAGIRAGNENVPPKQLLQQRPPGLQQAKPVPLGDVAVPAKRPKVLRDPRFNEFARHNQAPPTARLPEPNFVIYKDDSSSAGSATESDRAVSLEQRPSSQESGSIPPPIGVAAQVVASSSGSDFSFNRDLTASSLYAPNVSEFRQNVSISSVSSDDENENDLSYDASTDSSGLKSAKDARGVTDSSADDVEKSFDGELMLYDRNREAVPRWVLEVNDYEQDILLYARQSELRYLPKWNYMTKQSDITFAMRSILVDWLVEVGEEYQMGTETVYLAVNYIDRFLSFMSVQRAKLQLVGTSSIFIASKYEEIYPPDLGQFVYITDDTYTRKQILKMEQLILGVLGFSVTVPTAYYFVNHFSKLAGSSEKTKCLSQFLAELTLVNGETYLPYPPSVIAAAAVALARHTLGFAAWDASMVQKTGYCVEDFKHCLVNLHETFKNAKKSQQQAVVDKYKNAKHYAVSFTEPTSIF